MRPGHWLVGLIAVGVILALAVVFRARKYLHPKRRIVTAQQEQVAGAALPTLQNVEFRTKDGLRLRGWLALGAKNDIVIFVHGLGGNRYDLLPEAEVLASHGHGVLLYDSRASGQSDGDLATWGDRERFDLIAAIDLAHERLDADRARVGVFGFSVGGTASALVAAFDARVNAVVLGPTWTSIEDELQYKFRRWGPLSALAVGTFRAYGIDVRAVRPVDAMASIPPRPLLLVSGGADTDTPPTVMAEIHRRVPAASHWLIPNAGHGGFALFAREEFERRVAAFFDSAFDDQ